MSDRDYLYLVSIKKSVTPIGMRNNNKNPQWNSNFYVSELGPCREMFRNEELTCIDSFYIIVKTFKN